MLLLKSVSFFESKTICSGRKIAFYKLIIHIVHFDNIKHLVCPFVFAKQLGWKFL